MFIELIIILLVNTEPNKYAESEMREKIIAVLSQENFVDLVKNWEGKKSQLDSNWLYKGFIEKTRKIIDLNDEDPIITDGICFIASSIIFNNANSNSHDFIDLYNIYFSSKTNIETH